jgi:cysteine desulfurase/selenocysteine lyase
MEPNALEIEGLKIFGTAKRNLCISFNIEGIHPYDIGTIIDKLGIAVRTGHHCATDYDSIFRNNTFFFYNTKEEIDVMVEAVKRAALMLS